MRTILAMAAAAGFLAVFGTGKAQAARWCGYDAGAVLHCGFHSLKQCERSLGRRGSCRREIAYRQERVAPDRIPGQIYPSRPAWSSPYECFLDEGYGRFRPCNAGGDGGGGLN